MTAMKISLIRHILAAALLLTACGTHRPAADGSKSAAEAQDTFSAATYLHTIASRRSEQTHLTARVKVNIAMDSRSFATSGTLRMKRGDVVQIALTDPVLGIAEVGRMEFTPSHVLFFDRFNKQYVDVPYDGAAFLRRADVDFRTLESLFWNEIFVPGEDEPAPSDFTFDRSAASTVRLSHRGRLLGYEFTTAAADARLTRTAISPVQGGEARFSVDYADFTTFEGTPFPRQIVITFTMGQKQATLTLQLSSLRNNEDWITRTPTPSKYRRADVERIFRNLMQ